MQDEIHEMHIDYVKWTEFITKIYRKNIMMVFGKFNWSIVTKNGVHEQNIIDHQGSLNEWDVMNMWKTDLHLFDNEMEKFASIMATLLTIMIVLFIIRFNYEMNQPF